jgi:hypothetical protein
VNVIVTCGHPESGYRVAHEALIAAGLAPARPSCSDATSPTELQQKILRARELSLETGLSASEVLAAEVGNQLATDLFAGNPTEKNWGWADAETTWLLEFWKLFDARIQFVLVYSAPEFTIAKMLQTIEATSDNISRAIASWMTYNTELLRFYNRNSERCMLVNAAAVIREPARFVKRATGTIAAGIELLSSEPQPDRPDISMVAISLVKGLIGEYHQATALYQELENSGDFDDPAESLVNAGKFTAWQEYKELLEKLGCAVEERREQHKRATRLQLECGRFTKALKEVQSQTDELAGQLSDARASLEANKVQWRSSDLSHENELLRLQVSQIQEEIEYYIVKCEGLESDRRNELEQRAFQGRFLRQHVTNAAIDLRQDIDGDNWYYVEHDGRWAGPNEMSSLRMPALRPGSYNGQLDVTGSMEAGILREMAFLFNGKPLEFSKDWETYPALVLFAFTTDEMGDRPIWEFQFKFPKLICPANNGSEDRRNLAIKVRSMKLDIIT